MTIRGSSTDPESRAVVGTRQMRCRLRRRRRRRGHSLCAAVAASGSAVAGADRRDAAAFCMVTTATCQHLQLRCHPRSLAHISKHFLRLSLLLRTSSTNRASFSTRLRASVWNAAQSCRCFSRAAIIVSADDGAASADTAPLRRSAVAAFVDGVGASFCGGRSGAEAASPTTTDAETAESAEKGCAPMLQTQYFGS